ncbi:MAG: hypothetical protein MR436_10505 [Eubacterium sp.]|nr:hypothetical protein [Eubacterium sp.]
MDELYEIFSSLSNIDWNIKCMIHILKELQDAVPKRNGMEKLIGFLAYYLEHIEKDLEDRIERLDIYTLSTAEESSMSDQENEKQNNLDEYHVIYQKILSLQPQDILQLIQESETDKEKEFFELIGDYL